MASLQEIENALIAINDAAFQELCDDYLLYAEEGSPDINRTGSQKGKKKTKSGTPDSFWLLPTGKYVFAEYTTKEKKGRKADFLNKLKDDIKKCLSPKITKVEINKIQKIILCFNSEILPQEMEILKKMLSKTRVGLQFKSLDTIALDIFARYQHLAKKHLGLYIDTGQILKPKVFVEEYESGASLNSPLSNKFFFRENEILKIKADLASSDILIITGPPGVGKSKLALAAIGDWVTNNPSYEAFCISNKSVQIFEDLNSHLKYGKNYILLIDDANRQSQNLLQIFGHFKSRKKGRLKIILTVRDYAFEFIKNKCCDFEFTYNAVTKFTDEQLEEIIKSDDFKVKNRIYVKRILEIAKGNPRIALMAAKLALKHNKINVLHDLAEFYDSYFQTFITDSDVFTDEKILKVLGLISFFFSIDRSDKKFYDELLSDFEINHYEFTEACVHLERLELLESTADNTIIRISDQVLSAYFFYRVFLKEKLLDFSKLLSNYFERYPNRFRDTLIPANNDFGYQKVLQPIREELSSYLNSIITYQRKVHAFLDIFWFYLNEETFAFIYSQVEHLPVLKNPQLVLDKKNNNPRWNEDKNVKLISNFFYSSVPGIVTAIEIMLEYVARKPETYQQAFQKFTEAFGFSYEDERYSFYRQNKFIDLLTKNASKRNPVYLQLFFDLLPALLKTDFTVHGGSWKKNTVSFYHYHLPASQPSFRIRNKLWKQLDKVYELDKARAEEAVYEYITPKDYVKEILQAELPQLLKIIKKYFSPESFLNCYFVQKLIQRYISIGITHPGFDALKNQYYSKSYKTFKLADQQRLRNKEDHEYENLDYDKFERLKAIEVRYKLRVSKIKEFREFYKSFVEIFTSPHIQSWNFNHTLDLVIHEAYILDNSLGLKCLLEIQKSGNKTWYTPFLLFEELNKNSKNINDFFRLIIRSKYSFISRHEWVVAFLQLVKPEYIQKAHYTELLRSYNELKVYSYFDFRYLDKLTQFDANIYKTILQVFIDKAEQNINVRLDHHFFEKYLDQFQSDLTLPKKAYFICEKIEQHFDHDFKDFLALINLDKKFLLEYLVFIVKDKYALSPREYINFSSVWKLDNAEKLVKSAFDFFGIHKIRFVEGHFGNAFFKNLSAEKKAKPIKFLTTYLKANSRNIQKVDMILDIFRNSFKERYCKAVGDFLKINGSFETFQKLELLNSFFSSSGGVIWADIRAAELGDILTMINKLPQSYQYSKHKLYLKNWITIEKRSAERERQREFMRGDL